MVPLGEVAEKIAMGPFGSSIKVETFVPVGVPVISGAHLRGTRVEDSEFNFVTHEHAERLRNANVFRGDVIFTHAGNIGQAAYIPANSKYDRYVISQRQFYLRCNTEKVVPAFVAYYFKTHEGRHSLLANASQVGVPSIARPVTYLRTVLVPLPTLSEQRRIVQILESLDDKIELNRRMNETLETMARAIFKSWFVDFDPVRAKANGELPESICRRLGLTPDVLALFPDSFQESELGEIPKGWSIRKVEDISLKVGMGPFGSNIKVSTFVEDGIPVISGQHLNEEMLDDNTYKFVSTEHANRLASANVGRGDVIFTHAGNIGQVSYIPDHSRYDRYVLSQRQFYLRCDPSKVSHLFMTYFFRSPLGQHLLLANASQVGVPSIARPVSYLKSIALVIPPMDVLDRFDRVVNAFHHRVLVNRQETGTIAKVRDVLLPKLLSGAMLTKTNRSH